MKKKAFLALILSTAMLVPMTTAAEYDASGYSEDDPWDGHEPWDDEDGNIYVWNGEEYVNIGPGEGLSPGDIPEDLGSDPYAYYDGDGNVWFFDGSEDIYIGDGDHFYVDGDMYFENQSAGFVYDSEEYDSEDQGGEDWKAYQEAQKAEEAEDIYGASEDDEEAVLFQVIKGRAEEYPCHGEITVENLVNELEMLTGVVYDTDYYKHEKGIVVSFGEESSLFKGLPDGVTFDDMIVDNMEEYQWSILDSLAATLSYNLDYANIWFCGPEGENLKLESTELTNLPYFGSKFYEAYPDAVDAITEKEQAELILDFFCAPLLNEEVTLNYVSEEMVLGENAFIVDLEGPHFGETFAVTESGLICVQDPLSGEFEVIAPPAEVCADPEAGEIDIESTIPALCGVTFTGTTNLSARNDGDQGYYYADLTEDGLTTIVNACRPNEVADTIEERIRMQLGAINNNVSPDMVIEMNEELTALASYPVYILSWDGEETNEDASTVMAYFLETDTHSYLYQMCATGEAMMDFETFAMDTFRLLELF